PAWTGDVKVSGLVDFHSIEGVLTGRACHVEKDSAVTDRAIGLDVITHHYLLILVPVADVEIFLVGRKSDAVRSGEILRHELEIPIFHGEDATEGQLLARIVEELWQTKWRIGEVERSVAAVNKIVRAIQSFAFEFIRENGEC